MTQYGEKIKKRVEAETAEFDRRISEIAAEVREKLVVPLCRRRRLVFLSGNGMYDFSGEVAGQQVNYRDSLDETTPQDVRRVLAVLDTEVTHGQYLGYYVEAVRGLVSINGSSLYEEAGTTVSYLPVTGKTRRYRYPKNRQEWEDLLGGSVESGEYLYYAYVRLKDQTRPRLNTYIPGFRGPVVLCPKAFPPTNLEQEQEKE